LAHKSKDRGATTDGSNCNASAINIYYYNGGPGATDVSTFPRRLGRLQEQGNPKATNNMYEKKQMIKSDSLKTQC
jgi:hypothetical protein